MNNTVIIQTGNPIVNQVAKLNLTGNIIPEAWYHTIVNGKGKTNPLAILILADIVYWYRPTEVRDETSQSVTYTKKFHDDDYLQRSYDQLSEKFNISKKQARDAVVFLEDLGIIKRHLKRLNVGGMHLSNVMFIELLPDILEKLTFPDGRKTDSSRDADKGHNKNVDTPLQKGNMVNTNTEIPINGNGRTYTKTTTKTSTKSNIRTSCVRNFNERHYSDEEWKALELKLLNR